MSGKAPLRSRLAPRRLARLLRSVLGLAGAGQAGLAARDAFRLAFRGFGGAGCKAGRFRDPSLPASMLEAAPFAATLRHWGLAEEELPQALAFWRLEALAGFGLSAFALATLAAGLWMGQAPGVAAGASQRMAYGMAWSMAELAALHLAHLAKASMALAGLALGLAACWRRAVIRGRRFVPFAEWLCFWR